MSRLLYFHQVDERPTPPPFVEDGDGWWGETALPTIVNTIVAAVVAANALSAQIASRLPVDDIPSAGNLFGQYDEDFWHNDVAPELPNNQVPAQWQWEQNEIVPAPVAPDEDFWIPPLPYDWRPPPVAITSNEDETVTPPVQDEDFYFPPLPYDWRPPIVAITSNEDEITTQILPPDEDFYQPPLPYDWRPSVTAFTSNEDEIVTPPPPFGIDEDPLPRLLKIHDPLEARRLPFVEETPRPRPKFETRVKSFNVTLGAIGSTIVVPHDLFYKPQVVIATLSGRTESVNTNGRTSYKKGFGVAIQPSGQAIVHRTWGTHSDDAQALTQSSAGIRSDCIACIMETGPSPFNTKGRLSVLSIDATNVTFRIDEVFESDVRVQVQFIAGPDFTNIDLNHYSAPAAPGTQAITTPGFKPDFLLFFGGHTSGTPNTDENDSTTFIGAVDKNLNQWVMASGVNEAGGAGSGRAKSYARAGECICIVDTTVQTPDCRGQVSSLDSLGFTIDWTKITTTSGRRFIALAIRGANWAVGNFLSRTDTTENQVVSGLGFRPIGEILVSAAKAASVVDTLDNDEQWSVSLNQDVTVRNTQAVAQQNQVSPTVVSTAIDFDASYLALNVAGTVRAKAAISTIHADGFSIQHSVADSVASFIGYIAFAPNIDSGRRSVIITVKPTGGGDYFSLANALTSEVPNHRNLPGENILLEFHCYHGRDILPATVPSHYIDGVNGYITDRDHYIVIKAVEGHVGLPDESGATYLHEFDAAGSTTNGIKINAEFVKLIQIQQKLIADATTPSGYRIGADGSIAPAVRIEFINCIQFGDYSGTFAGSGFRIPVEADGPDAKYIFVNCIVYDCLNLDLVPHGFNNSEFTLGGLVYMYNCEAYNCNTGWFDRTTAIHKNCCATYCDNGWRAIAGAPNAQSTNNVSTCSDTPNPDAQGTNARNKARIYMVDPMNNDIRPEGGDNNNGKTGNGVSLYSDPVFPFNFDVANTPRIGTWDSGAFRNTRAFRQRVRWGWVGGVTSTSAKVNVGLNDTAADVRLRVGTDPTLATYVEYGPAFPIDDVAKFTGIVVVPDTRYYYQVMADGELLEGIRSFRSFPSAGLPASYSIACGGCSDFGSNTNVFNVIRQMAPNIFIDMGDMTYANILTNDEVLFRNAYEGVMLTPKRRALYDTIARAYVWDDHDFDGPNSEGTAVPKPAAEAEYRVVVPSYTLPSALQQIYQSFVIGRVRCILTDLRSERSANAAVDDAAKTMMGAEQKAWFKSEISAAAAAGQFVIWFSTVPWIAQVGVPGEDNDHWGGFTTERRELSDYIQANGMEESILIVTGDMHSAIIDNGEHNLYTTDGQGNGAPVFGPFPLNQRNAVYAGTWTYGPHQHTGIRLLGVFGLISIDDNGQRLVIRLDVIDERGVQLTYSFETTCFPKVVGSAAAFTKVVGAAMTPTKIAGDATTFTKITGSDPCE